MNSSLFTADRCTHVKIVALALVAAFIVAMVGINSRQPEPGASAARRDGRTLVVKAGEPARYSSGTGASIR